MKRGKKEMKRKGTWVEISNFLVLKICMRDSPKRITNTFAFVIILHFLVKLISSGVILATQSENYQRLIFNEWSQFRHQVFQRLAGVFFFSLHFYFSLLPLIHVCSLFSSKLLRAVPFSFFCYFLLIFFVFSFCC